MSPRDHASPPLLRPWELDAHVSLSDPAEIQVLPVDLGPVNDSEQPEALPHWAFLAEDERVRGLRFVRPPDRRRFVICRGALRVILGRPLETPPALVRFRPGPGGKPELAPEGGPDPAPRLRFTFWNSHNLALLAVSLGPEPRAAAE